MPDPIMTMGEEKIAFYYAIGETITQWAYIEYALFFVAHRALAAGDAEQLRRALMSIENFRSKLAFVNRAVIGSSAMTAFVGEWNTINAHILALSSKRNSLAHWRAMLFLDGQEGRRLALVAQIIPPPSKKSKKNLAPPGVLAVRDIDLIRQQFSRAQSMIMSFYLRAGGDEDFHGESAQLEPRPQTLAQLARQIRAVRPLRE